MMRRMNEFGGQINDKDWLDIIRAVGRTQVDFGNAIAISLFYSKTKLSTLEVKIQMVMVYTINTMIAPLNLV